jgi:hypothetical protein
MRRLVAALVLVSAIGLGGCGTAAERLQRGPMGYQVGDADTAPSRFSDFRWKAVLVAADGSIPAFDNAVRDLATRLRARGVDVVAVLSARSQRPGERAVHADLRDAIGRLKPAPAEGCLLFFTSHGTVHGLNTPQDGPLRLLAPNTLADLLDAGCGGAPTIVVVSACYSGTFHRERLARPNRILMTAASENRMSFGCRADQRYTFYDRCFLTELDHASTWQALYERIRSCISSREANLKELPSQPQAFFGREMKNLRLPQP